MSSLFQHSKSGQLVELISFHDKDYAMVRTASGTISYVALADLVGYEADKGRTGEVPVSPNAEKEAKEDKVPESVIPPDNRLNLNVATAEMLASRIKGVGYSTAKMVIERRMSLPGERFANLDQVRKIGRVNWDQVIEDDLIFVA